VEDGKRKIEWKTADEICAHLNIGRTKLYRMVKTKKIPFHYIGESLRFDIFEVDKFFSEPEVPLSAAPLPAPDES